MARIESGPSTNLGPCSGWTSYRVSLTRVLGMSSSSARGVTIEVVS